MVGGTWWAVSGGWYMVCSEWWVVHGGQNGRLNVRSLMVECFVFVNVILVKLVVVVVVVVYIVNDGGGNSKYLCMLLFCHGLWSLLLPPLSHCASILLLLLRSSLPSFPQTP